jgi:hypothetical protein
MATITIPVTNDPDSTARYVLDGTLYEFRFRYNDRGAAWYFDLIDENESAIIYGRKIVVSWPLFGWREVDSRLPGGRLLACDTTDADLDPTLEDFGARVVLQYIEAVDIV